MLDQKIDHLHAPEVSVEVLFPFRLEQVVEQRRGTGAFRDRLQKLRRCLGDAAIAQERFAQSGLAGRTLHRLVALRADRLDDFVDQRRIVCRPNRHRVADLVVQAPTGQIDFEMARVLFGIFAAKTAVDDELARERIRARVG